MAIRDALRALWAGQSKASVIGLPDGQLPDRPLEKGWDDASILSTYQDDPWPYICANKIGEQASLAPLRVGTLNRDGEFKAVDAGHPVQRLLDAPNPTIDGGEFVHLLLIYMEMVGHAPIEAVRPTRAGGRLVAANVGGFELWLHNPGPWRIVANADATVKGYLWLERSQTDLRWLPGEMTYLRWPNPNNRWYGLGRIAAVRQAVMAEEYAGLRDKNFEKRMGVPPGILTSEMPLGEPQATELQKRWEQAVGGYRNAGKIAVLGSKTTYQSVALTARDAQWLAQRNWRVEEICGAFGVPLVLVKMSDATFSNAEQARAEFWEGTLQPRLDRIARMLTARVIPMVTNEPLVLRFDYSAVKALNENSLEVAQQAVQWGLTGAVSVDEIRHRLDLPPLGSPMGDRLIIPGTLTLKLPDEVAQSAEMGMQGAAAALEMQRNPPPAAQEPPPPPGKAVAPSAVKAAPSDRETRLAPVRDAYVRDLASYFTAQEGALRPIFGEAKALPTDEGDETIRRVIEIITAKRFRDRLARISRGVIEMALTLGATEAAGRVGVPATFVVPVSEEAVAAVNAALVNLSRSVEGTTVADVTRVLQDGLRAGLERPALREELRKLFTDYQDWRLDRISRTETSRAFNGGAVGQYRLAGLSQVDVVDGDGDDRCAQANGSRWSLEEADGDPIAHPNCTRTFIAVIPDEPSPDTSFLGSMPETTKDGLVTVRIPAVTVTPTPVVAPKGVVSSSRSGGLTSHTTTTRTGQPSLRPSPRSSPHV